MLRNKRNNLFGKFISVDTTQKKIYVSHTKESYDIGELLIKFLEMNFRPYENERKKIKKEIKDASKVKDMGAPEYTSSWLYQKMLDFGKEHPYFRAINLDVLGETEYYVLLDDTFNLQEIKDLFMEAFNFCLYKGYKSELEHLNALQRYFIYNALHNSPFKRWRINAKVHYEPMIIKGSLGVGDYVADLSDLLSLVEDKDLVLAEQYIGYDIASLLYIEFSKMVSLNIQVATCDHCGRFFILKGLYPARYCNRRVQDSKHTCRTIGATLKYKEKMSHDPIYKLYRKTYKRINTRKNNNIISNEEFDQLKEKIAGLRRNVQEDSISFDAFKFQMDNI